MPRSPLDELFPDVDKPVIGMVHFPPLPGTPLYDEQGGLKAILDRIEHDIAALVSGGVDGLLFCNEGDRPYQLKVGPEAVAVMTRGITQFVPPGKTFGVDVLWDPYAAIAVAMATGASFVREVFTGTFESDMGLWAPDAADIRRYHRRISAQHIKLFYNTTPEFASPIGKRAPADMAVSAVVSSLADTILVSGPAAGSNPALDVVSQVRAAVPKHVPVLVNTGVNENNVTAYLQIADGVIVGSSLKRDGITWNEVELDRVKRLISQVNNVRRQRQTANANE